MATTAKTSRNNSKRYTVIFSMRANGDPTRAFVNFTNKFEQWNSTYHKPRPGKVQVDLTPETFSQFCDLCSEFIVEFNNEYGPEFDKLGGGGRINDIEIVARGERPHFIFGQPILCIGTARGDVIIREDQLPTITDAELKRFRISRADLQECFAVGKKLMEGQKPSEVRPVASERLDGTWEVWLVAWSRLPPAAQAEETTAA